ncbi:MAG TPA: heme-binding protein [Alphaproteobacteria bacterium]|jgi:glc operon protein GlcG|nr:heme-binding protein [Alphaproteobacteria bacterium]
MQQKPCLTREDADRMLQAARNAATTGGFRVSIAIVDAAGDLLAFSRLDGAIGPSCSVAIHKARTAALWKRDTLYWEKRVAEKPTYAALPDNFAVEGGVPVEFEGHCVGGIGVSGARTDDDARIAAAGAARVKE